MCIPYSAQAWPLNRSSLDREKIAAAVSIPSRESATRALIRIPKNEGTRDYQIGWPARSRRILRDNKAGTENEGGGCRCQPGFRG